MATDVNPQIGSAQNFHSIPKKSCLYNVLPKPMVTLDVLALAAKPAKTHKKAALKHQPCKFIFGIYYYP
jgi:hypothetical protein